MSYRDTYYLPSPPTHHHVSANPFFPASEVAQCVKLRMVMMGDGKRARRQKTCFSPSTPPSHQSDSRAQITNRGGGKPRSPSPASSPPSSTYESTHTTIMLCGSAMMNKEPPPPAWTLLILPVLLPLCPHQTTKLTLPTNIFHTLSSVAGFPAENTPPPHHPPFPALFGADSERAPSGSDKCPGSCVLVLFFFALRSLSRSSFALVSHWPCIIWVGSKTL